VSVNFYIHPTLKTLSKRNDNKFQNESQCFGTASSHEGNQSSRWYLSPKRIGKAVRSQQLKPPGQGSQIDFPPDVKTMYAHKNDTILNSWLNIAIFSGMIIFFCCM
jgi:hypothetical protein